VSATQVRLGNIAYVTGMLGAELRPAWGQPDIDRIRATHDLLSVALHEPEGELPFFEFVKHVDAVRATAEASA
jgi:hypothetical protein